MPGSSFMTGSKVSGNFISLRIHPGQTMGSGIEGSWSEKDCEGGSQGMKAGVNLEKVLEKGVFAVTGEFNPPQGATTSVSSNEKQGS